jgi:hypothetical protein
MRTNTTKTLAGIPQGTRVWLHRVGSSLGMVGVLFVGAKLYEYQGQIGLQNVSALEYAWLAGVAVVYGASNVFLAFGWRLLLSALKTPVPIRWAVWAYAVSQLGKYIPGNIFQFAGRQAIGLAAGLPGWPLAKSMVLELTFISLSGAVFSILILPLLSDIPIFISTVLFMGAAIGLALATWIFGDSKAASAVACYLLFLVLSGTIFSVALEISNRQATVGIGALSMIVGAYVIAWLAGLLTPGAPAGAGIREAVLLILLSGHVAGPAILLAVVLGRIVTVAGDLLFYVVGSLVPHN